MGIIYGCVEYCNIQKPRDFLQKQQSSSLPLGTVDFDSGFVPLAKPVIAIETICSRVWWPKETFLTIQQNTVIRSYVEYLNKGSHTLKKAELNPLLCITAAFQLADIRSRYFVIQLPSLHKAKLPVLVNGNCSKHCRIQTDSTYFLLNKKPRHFSICQGISFLWHNTLGQLPEGINTRCCGPKEDKDAKCSGYCRCPE